MRRLKFSFRLKKFHFRSKKAALLIGIASGVVLGLGTIGVHQALATNCMDGSNNSILTCGKSAPEPFIDAVKKNDDKDHHHDLQAIYAHFDLVPSDYSKFVTHAVMGVAKRDGNIEVDGHVVATDAWSIGRDHFSYAVPYQIDGKTYYKSQNTQVLLSNIPVMVLFNDKGVMQFAVMTACGNPTQGHNDVPQYSCDQLNERKVSDNTYAFSTKASASDGANVVKAVYDFGDGSPTVTETSLSKEVQHTYKQSGTFTAKVTVTVSLPGNQTVEVTSTKCQKQITVALPFQQCVNLVGTPTDSSKLQYQFVVTSKQGNGSTLKSADFNFGDGKTDNGVAPSSANTVTDNHTYVQPQTQTTYTITATVHFDTPGGAKDSNCTTTITITPPVPFEQCKNLTQTLLDSTTNKYQFVANTEQGNGAVLKSADFNFGDGQSQNGVAPSSSTTVTADHTFAMPQTQTTYTITATVHFNTPQGVKDSNCQTQITITPPAPFEQCVKLVPTLLDATTNKYQFVANTKQGNGAVLKGADFNFGDGKTDNGVAPSSANTVTDTHAYATAGTYTIVATVHFNLPDGSTKDVNCQTTITPTPAPTCDALTLTKEDGRTIEAAVTYTLDGATLTSADFNFGDGTIDAGVTPAADSTLTDSHTYAKDGSYTVSAKLTFMVNGKPMVVDGANCSQPISFTTTPTCTAPNGQKYPVGSPQCKPKCTAPNGQQYPMGSPQCTPKCTAPNGQQFPAGSSQCKPAVPAKLVNTGPGSMIGLFAAVTIASGFGYHYFLSRRLSRGL